MECAVLGAEINFVANSLDVELAMNGFGILFSFFVAWHTGVFQTNWRL
jgi:hypothetical protein